MKVAVMSLGGGVGKTTIAVNLLSPRLPETPIYSVESINESASDLGMEAETFRAAKFREIYKNLMKTNNAIVDVGASNIEVLLSRMTEYDDAHAEFDYFVIPTIPSTKEQKECIKLVENLSEVGVPSERIRIIFNQVEADASDEFGLVFGYAKKAKTCIVNSKAAIFSTELFDLLGTKKTSIGKVLADDTDYRALIRAMDPEKQRREVSDYADMAAMKSMSAGVNRQLDKAFAALFA